MYWRGTYGTYKMFLMGRHGIKMFLMGRHGQQLAMDIRKTDFGLPKYDYARKKMTW